MQEPEIPPGEMTWGLLESVFRNYYEFYELYTVHGLDEINVNGVRVNVHDILKGVEELPERQRQAVVLMCLENYREVDAAAVMLPGSKWSSPVGAYKRAGLQKIVERAWCDEDVIDDNPVEQQEQCPGRTIPRSGRVFCRQCTWVLPYDGLESFSESVRQLRNHSCMDEGAA